MKKMLHIAAFCLGAFSAMATDVHAASPLVGGIVTLHADSEVKTLTVKLSDLFTGLSTDIDRDIAQAPQPGKTAVYDSNVLTKLAQKYNIDWHAQSLMDHVTISAAVSRITNDAIRDAVIAKVRQQGAKGSMDVSFDTRNLQIDLPASLPNTFALNGFDFDVVSKRFRADLVAQGPEGPFTVPLAGRVQIKQRVPVLAHRLEEGTVIGMNDIDWAEVPDERIGANTLTDARDLVNHELRRTTSEGEPLHGNDVISPRLVKRGTICTLKIATALMVLTAQGKALQDGAVGDTVRVLNTQSNRMIEGTVDQEGNVAVHVGQKFAALPSSVE